MTPEPTESEPTPTNPKAEQVGQHCLVRRLFEGTTVYLYSVKLLREDGDDPCKQKCFEEFYAAQRIEDVWAAIETELADEGVEVESVSRHVPILAFLQANDQCAGTDASEKDL